MGTLTMAKIRLDDIIESTLGPLKTKHPSSLFYQAVKSSFNDQLDSEIRHGVT